MRPYVERADWLRTPGRRIELIAGPFEFYLSTADEGWLAFCIALRWFKISWEWQGRPE
jgi:hypothetical protein